jgi:hypothetical protein
MANHSSANPGTDRKQQNNQLTSQLYDDLDGRSEKVLSSYFACSRRNAPAPFSLSH